ncbi:protein of unknown function [Micromonospora echinospora]|uniref:DUF4291 domain-containing protein n=2 Tax=Micromonospora echinospora TaxID=1877 RepID=A0A1C4ZV68_MICEC|nr:protein of unknown function [Micromonospora echinospora]
MISTMDRPYREIRAGYGPETITVYQAYAPAVAGPALRHGRFVAPFKRERMTWIKPSFRWMMYRCGWGAKPDQECVLAIDISRAGFEWALANSCLSHHDPDRYPDRAAWSHRLRRSPVRVQWDPERDLDLRPLPHRSLQVGLSGVAVDRYVDDWIVDIRDVTPTAHAVRARLVEGDRAGARSLLPDERPYPLPADVAAHIGASTDD